MTPPCGGSDVALAIALEQDSDLCQVSGQRAHEVGGQHRHPILAALAIAHVDGEPIEIEILNA